MTAVRIFIVFYSTLGHVHTLARAVAEGAAEVEGAKVDLFQVAETVPPEILDSIGATAARAAFADVPVLQPNRLAEADAILFGTPTRYGMMAAQMRNFLDQTGGLWVDRALVGKPGSVFTSTSTQHGGQESTLLSFHTTLLHHGMVVVGLPYTATGQSRLDEITGGSPYGASTITGPDGSRLPSANELELCRFQGRHVTTIAAQLAEGRARLAQV